MKKSKRQKEQWNLNEEKEDDKKDEAIEADEEESMDEGGEQ